jgi:hypothetical protein
MKRLKYMTPLHCLCGAKGDLVWSEDETSPSTPSENYEIVSVTELFAVSGDMVACRLCDRVVSCPGGAAIGSPPTIQPDKSLQGGLLSRRN